MLYKQLSGFFVQGTRTRINALRMARTDMIFLTSIFHLWLVVFVDVETMDKGLRYLSFLC